ncbi:hypothetical protein GCM10010269_50190 [Streptomyces humidus]|uniref:Uncharacterized protein n=1 Tax=Streptomyces humidus TaxID=52259 RepID=A0A918FZG2_9ACTN|nr:hypothetical protein [Streptomyces humidus]GGS05297.1 hypothetical protein GCM10010269_50190 [Streptomyces humidus]
MIAHPLSRALHGGPHADGTAWAGELPAGGPAAATTALAATGYCLAFARTLSCAACVVVALVFFAGAVLRSRAPAAVVLSSGLGAMVSAQATACCWLSFTFSGPGPGPGGGTLHGGAGGAIHLAMTLVTVCALRAVAGSRLRLLVMTQAAPPSVFRRLRALLFARTSTRPAVDPSRCSGARAEDERRVPEVQLAGVTGRRGPPRPGRTGAARVWPACRALHA